MASNTPFHIYIYNFGNVKFSPSVSSNQPPIRTFTGIYTCDEHLETRKVGTLNTYIKYYNTHGISGINDTVPLLCQPYGECSFLYIKFQELLKL